MRIIAGIDPGTTTGIAILDLETKTKFYKLFSEKNFSFSRVCEYISDNGTPVVIATDVSKPPRLIKKLVAAFNAVLVKPKRSMTTLEKRKLIKGLDAKFKNNHEKDALAAALYAKKRLSVFLRKIDRILKKKGCAQLNDDVKELIIKGRANNVERALLLIRKQ